MARTAGSGPSTGESVLPGQHVFAAPEGAPRLDLLIAAKLGISRTAAATLIATRNATVLGRHEKASYKPAPGEAITVLIPEPRGRDVLPQQIPLDVVFEDEHLLAIDKPAGMVVHPAPGNWSGTLANALKGRGGALSPGDSGREGIVHRLDKETSGLLLVAKDERTHRLLSAALQARRVSRRYAVLIRGHLRTDRVTVEKPIGRDPRDRKRMAVVSSGRPARTDLVRLARFDISDLLRAHLHTGRTHQIRVHLSSIGHPVAGDDTYGGGGARRLLGLPERRHFLHAAWMIFRHPITGVELDLRAPLPKELSEAVFAAAGEHAPADTPGDVDLLDHFGFYRLHL